jgi:hypothetical protein
MSQRSKRRRGPHRREGEGATPTGRPREEISGARPGEARQAGEAASPGSSSQARTATRGSGRDRPAPSASDRATSGWSLGVQLAFLVAVFAVVVLVAELAGAANLGVALGVGQIAFAIAVIYLLLRR